MSMTVAGYVFNYLRRNADVSWGFWLRLMWGGSFSNPPFSDLRPVRQIGDRRRHSQNFGMCTATQKSYILERRALWTLPLQRMVVWRQPVPLSRCLFFLIRDVFVMYLDLEGLSQSDLNRHWKRWQQICFRINHPAIALVTVWWHWGWKV